MTKDTEDHHLIENPALRGSYNNLANGNEYERIEETKIFSDISIQAGDPAIKMVRFNVEHEPSLSNKKKSKYKVREQKYFLHI